MKSLLFVVLVSLLFYGLASYAAGPVQKLTETPNLTSSIKTGGEGVEMISGVNFSLKDKKYIYSYVFKNVGKKKSWLVSSSVPDRAMGLSGSFRESYHHFLLKPGEKTVIKLSHKDLPEEFHGKIICLGDETNRELDKSIEITGNKPAFYFKMAGVGVGYLPKSLVPKRK